VTSFWVGLMVFGGMELRSILLRMRLEVNLYYVMFDFGFNHWCFTYIQRLYSVVLFFPTSIRLVQRPITINNTFAVKKKR
jgi:hypothetical protein